MKKRNHNIVIAILALVFVAAAGAVFWMNQTPQSATVSGPKPALQTTTGPLQKPSVDADTADTTTTAYARVPVPGMVTMVDLGADNCVPCKMMAPILKKVENDYRGRAAIIFLDVWKDPAPARRFGIRVIPTQIFFDKDGREMVRHEGFMDEATIVRHLRRLGVDAASS